MISIFKSMSDKIFKDMIVGGVAGIISRTATAPMELYKIQRQNQYLKDANFTSVLKKEGIRYLWKGNFTNCLRVFPQIATNFSVFEKVKNGPYKKIQNETISLNNYPSEIYLIKIFSNSGIKDFKIIKQ